MDKELLTVNDLTVALHDVSGGVILENVSCAVRKGAILGIVGGSGSGKTTLGMAVLGIVPSAMRVVSGQIIFEGKNILDLSREEMRRVRGSRIGMVFQEPMSAFDPVFTVGAQIRETILAHRVISKSSLEKKILALLEAAGVPDPRRVAQSYSHELSGGLRQRAMIAQAISCEPALLIADEPTSSLDVTLQAHIMELLRRIRKDLGVSILLISHDLGMVRNLADEVVILDRGRVVESGCTKDVMTKSKEPYTKALMECEM